MDPSYNNSFNGGQMAAQGTPIISSGNGVAMPQNRDGGRRWLIAVGVVLVALAVVLGAVVLVMNRGKGGVNYDVLYGQYAGLLVNGNANSTVNSSDFSVKTVAEKAEGSFINVARSGDPLSEDNISYYKNLNAKLAGLTDAAARNTGMSDETKNLVTDLVRESETALSVYFVNSALIYSDVVYVYYMNNNTLEGIMPEYGYPFKETEDLMMQDMEAYVNLYMENRREYYAEVQQLGCIKDGGIDYECVSVNKTGKIAGLETARAELKNVMTEQGDDLAEVILANAKQLKEIAETTNNG